MYSLKKIALDLGGYVHGDDSVIVNRIATLKSAQPGQLSFLANCKYISDLKITKASAVLLTKEELDLCPTNALVLKNPYLALAKVVALFDRTPEHKMGIHPSASVASSAKISKSASIGAHVVIGEHVNIAVNAVVGANCVILNHSSIGQKTEIKPNVTIYHGVHIGEYCIIHANTVIGSDGFGNVKDESGNWVKIAQIGGVTIGNHVEIGASTSIDRGTIDDTIIADGVKIDNQVQIAHNVIIGENTAIAGSTGIAGSVTIGKDCLLGGQVGVNGHLNICDGVMLAGSTNVSKSITKPGFYHGAFGVRPHMEWKRISARIFQLDKVVSRVKILEKKCKDSE